MASRPLAAAGLILVALVFIGYAAFTFAEGGQSSQVSTPFCSPQIQVYFSSPTNVISWYCGSLLFSGTNASVVIQNTINACTTACTITLGNGTFNIGNMPLTPKNNVALRGASPQVTTLNLLPGVARHILFDNVGNLYNFTAEDIGFNGNKYSQTDPTGALARVNGELVLIAGRGNQHIHFDNVLCQLARTGACLDLTSYDATLTNSVVQNNGVTGAAIASDAVHMGGGNITLASRVVGNLLANNTDTGLALDNVRGSDITGNKITNAFSADMTLDQGSQADTVTGNTFNMTSYAGSWLTSLVVGGSASQNVTVSGNTFYCNNQTTSLNRQMINVVSSKSWTIESNTMVCSIENSNDFMMQFVTDNNLNVHGNTLVSSFGTVTSESMMFIKGVTNYTIYGNNIYGGNNGMQFATTTSSTGSVHDNSFFGTKTPVNYLIAPTVLHIFNNIGYNPIGKVALPFNNRTTVIAPWGNQSVISKSLTYTIQGADVIVTCTGGTTVTLTVADNLGNTIFANATLKQEYIPYGYELKTNAWATAPTCNAYAI